MFSYCRIDTQTRTDTYTFPVTHTSSLETSTDPKTRTEHGSFRVMTTTPDQVYRSPTHTRGDTGCLKQTHQQLSLSPLVTH